ncbi:hypothetical protein CHS0354_014797 [Potamilus streckersoni]|uniref:Uncharacterized protein n=1 Tax=Potamilus streckersoni TaxID=2493646 RepID=A0AAE0VZV9_9BIVA|nr:hypothetical protein CHS0354_014797 [Potamilus streckersoni]
MFKSHQSHPGLTVLVHFWANPFTVILNLGTKPFFDYDVPVVSIQLNQFPLKIILSQTQETHKQLTCQEKIATFLSTKKLFSHQKRNYSCCQTDLSNQKL